MDITLSPEQQSALARSLAMDGGRESLEEFALAAINSKLNEHVAAWKGRDADAIAAKVRAVADRLEPEDVAAIEAIVEARKPAAEEPPAEEPAGEVIR